MNSILTFEDWLNDEFYQKHFDIQVNLWYFHGINVYGRKNMEVVDFKQHMLLRLLQTWKHYNGEFSIVTYTMIVIKRETIRLKRVYENQRNKLNFVDTTVRIEEYEFNGIKFEVKANDEEEPIHETIEYIINDIKGIDRDICKLYLLGHKMSKIAKFTGLSYRQIQYKLQTKYKPIFQARVNEYYGY